MVLKRYNFFSGALLVLALMAFSCTSKPVVCEPQVTGHVTMESNISHKGDTLWFSVDFKQAGTKSSAEYLPISYRLLIDGEVEGKVNTFNGPDDLHAYNRSEYSNSPEYTRYWQNRYGSSIPDNVVFITVPDNASETARTILIQYSVSSDNEWTNLFEGYQDAKPAEIRNPFKLNIPLEYPNPVANLILFDIDKDGQCMIVSEHDFAFEILNQEQFEDSGRKIDPKTEYEDEWITIKMTEENSCLLSVRIQEKPYKEYSNHLVFYKEDQSVIEHFVILIGEDYTNMDW